MPRYHAFAVASQEELDNVVALLKEHNASPGFVLLTNGFCAHGDNVHISRVAYVERQIRVVAVNRIGSSDDWFHSHWPAVGRYSVSHRKMQGKSLWERPSRITDAETFPSEADWEFPQLPTFAKLAAAKPYMCEPGTAYLSPDVAARYVAGTLTEPERSRLKDYSKVCTALGGVPV